jgi:hypothetical protein
MRLKSAKPPSFVVRQPRQPSILEVCICFISILSDFYVDFTIAWNSLVGIFINKACLKIRAKVLGPLKRALRRRIYGGFPAYHPNTGQQPTIGRSMVNSVLQPLSDVGREGTLWIQPGNGGVCNDLVDQSAVQQRLFLLRVEPHGDAVLTQQR